MTPNPAPPTGQNTGQNTARARVRAELICEITGAARRQLGEGGASALSLRAVAREVGMVSSAVYRYFPSRDALLTTLIVDSYNAVGEAAEAAERAIDRGDLMGRWLALSTSMRQWAVDSPQEYALIFGSPVPGYRAPTDTIDPAARIPLLLLALLDAADQAAPGPSQEPDGPRTPAGAVAIPASVAADLGALRDQLAPGLSIESAGRAVMAWTQLVGSISIELFGHLNNVIHDYGAYFEYQMRLVGAALGLGPD